MAEVTVGIDIGTTSVKAVAADADGSVLARCRLPHRLNIPGPDLMDHDAAQAWRRGPRRALAQVSGAGVEAVCVAAMVPSVTAVDGKGIPRTPGLLYGDARGVGHGGAGANPSGSGEASEFVRWSAEQMPGARGFWPAQAVANFALSGEAVIDTGTAFTAYPLFDGNRWDESRAEELGVTTAQLPRVVAMGAAAAEVDGAVLASGTIDAMAEQIVAGADEPGDVLVICGTTLIIWAVVGERTEAPGLWSIPHHRPDLHIVGGASNAGGLFLNWAHSLLGRPRQRRVEKMVDPARVPVWIPYPRGERTPHHDPSRRALLADLDLTHDAAAVERAAYEASGFVVRHHLDLARLHPRRIVATGGGTRVEAWVRALADCTGLPVDVVSVPEGAALGAAFMARLAAGLETSMGDAARWSSISRTVEPDARWEGPASERYVRFRELAGGPAWDGGGEG